MRHLCECGCGEETRPILKTDSRKGWYRGNYYRFLFGHKGKLTTPVLRRFWTQVIVNPDTGCWEWVGGHTASGYGYFNSPLSASAHVFSYLTFNGPIPPGTEPDHVCRNRGCVNPDHLEAVTHQENVLRGVSVAATHARKTCCPKGHPYDRIVPNGHPGGQRRCSICYRESWRRWYHSNSTSTFSSPTKNSKSRGGE